MQMDQLEAANTLYSTEQLKKLEKLAPLWRIAEPYLKQKAAEKTAAYFNQRRRKRLNLPEPTPEGCPPVDFTPADCPPTKPQWAWIVASGVIGLMIGGVVGLLVGRR